MNKQQVSIPRSALHEEWKSNYKTFKQNAEDNRLSLAGYLNIISPEPESPYGPPNALHTLMQKEGLRMEATRHAPASLLQEFMENEERKDLFYADMDDHYDSCFDEYPRSSVRNPASLGQFTAGDPFRPFQDTPVVERKRKAPRLRLNQIVGVTDTITGVDLRRPEYTTPDINEQMQEVGEGSLIPVATITMGSRNITLKKVALGLRWTYEFARNSEIRVDQLRRWVTNVAIQHEIALVQEGLTMIMATVDGESIHEVGKASNKNFTTADITSLLFELDEPYQVDTVVGGPGGVVSYLGVVGQSTTGGAFLDYFQRMHPELVPSPNPLNNIMLPTQYGVVKSNIGPAGGVRANSNTLTVTGSNPNDLLLFDSAETLGYIRQLNSETNELDTDPSQQFVTRYLSRYYGFYLNDFNGRMKVYFT